MMREILRSSEKSSVVFLVLKKTINEIKLDSYSESVVSIFVPFILSSKRLCVTSLVWQEIVCRLPLHAPVPAGVQKKTCLQPIQLPLSYTTHSASLGRVQTDTA